MAAEKVSSIDMNSPSVQTSTKSKSQPLSTTAVNGVNNNTHSKTNNNSKNNNSKKNVDNTVFVRFVPPSSIIRRHHVEELFSQCGPIKKSSIIHTTTPTPQQPTTPSSSSSTIDDTPSSSYGFVKYTTREDAEVASKQLNNRTLTIDGTTVTVKVELAKKQITETTSIKNSSVQGANSHTDTPIIATSYVEREQDHKKKSLNELSGKGRSAKTSDPGTGNNGSVDIKKTNRLIIRNLSFYAKESDIKKALQVYGKLVDVHIPKVVVTKQVQATNTKGKVIPPTHRGFAFVTFESEDSTEQCLMQGNNIVIKERMVQISRSLHKTAYTLQQQEPQTPRQSSSSDTNGNVPTGKIEDLGKDDNADEEMDDDDDDDDDDEDEDGDEDVDNDDDDDVLDSSISKHNYKKDENGSTAKDDTAIAEGRCLFVRNLPFDCTRHDIFDTFRIFGYVTSIFIVKTETSHGNSSAVKTLLPKGTAFVTFQKQDHAKKALEYANPMATTSDTTNFVSQRAATSAMTLSDSTSLLLKTDGNTTDSVSSPGIIIKGRRLLVDVAVDKETASTLIGGEKNADKIGYKDRRNLYLKNEGRVDNNEAKNIMTWDELPEGDKLKRQTAWSEKNTKLRSPLFYINPHRLSIRNLAKHVDEVALKKLIVTAIRRGLYENKLVQPDDQIAHWRASGEFTTREILAKIQDGDATGNGILPPFDEKNVKQSIPSLHIHRDVVSGGNKNMAPSRGFGFVEFQHHAHALACLRELNNNPSYSKEYAIGGKQVALMKERRKRNNSGKKRKTEPSVNDGGSKIIDENFVTADGNIRTPRLIVEFTVENKAKAKQQAEHKAKQQANQIKQRMESKSDGTAAAAATPPQPKIKKSRGAIQREKKRQRQNNPQEQDNDDCKHDDANPVAQGTVVSKSDESTLLSSNSKKKARVVAPPKKPAKLDVEELTFSNLVASYQQQATSTAGTTDTVIGSSSADNMSKPKRRWYE